MKKACAMHRLFWLVVLRKVAGGKAFPLWGKVARLRAG